MQDSIDQSLLLRSVPLAHINLADDSFRITTKQDIKELAVSIGNLGLLNPPLVVKKKSSFTIVSGFRRVSACHELGWSDILTRMLSPDLSHSRCLRIAIADNAFQRPLNLIEISRCIHKLLSNEINVQQLTKIAGVLGLPVNPSLIRRLSNLCLLPVPIQESILTGTISLSMANELESLDSESAVALASLFAQLKMGLNRQREIVMLVKEIAKREHISPRAVLRKASLRRIIEDRNLDKAQANRHIRHVLRKWRFPEISRTQQLYEKHAKNLKLGRSIRLIPPNDFEGNVYTLTMSFSNLTELQTLRHKMEQLARNSSIKTILERKSEEC